MDFFSTFSPMGTLTTVRVLIAIAVAMNLGVLVPGAGPGLVDVLRVAHRRSRKPHGNATHLFDLDIESAAGGGPVRGGPSREVSDPQLKLKRGP